MKQYILGISCFYHDSAAALICNGKILGAVQEERFSRCKNDSTFPLKSVKYLLENNKIALADVEAIFYYEKPFLTFERLIASYIQTAPFGLKSFMLAIPIWIKKKLFLKQNLVKEFRKFDKDFSDRKLFFSEHHLSHAAGSFYDSGFSEAVILVLDGVGEWATTTVAIGRKNKISLEKEIRFPNSLGLLYSSFTGYLGFEVNEGEYKMMGLAPFGQPKFRDLIKRELVDIKKDGSFRLNMKYFNYISGLTMTNKNFNQLFGKSPRAANDPILPIHADLAASIQAVTEEILLKMVGSLSKEYSIPNLCLSGGVALNCVANGKIVDSGCFQNVWVQPASGDAGGAMGAALVGSQFKFKFYEEEANRAINRSPYLGPSYSQEEIEKELIKVGAVFEVFSFKEIKEKAAEMLANGKIIGWFQGALEFGPRALGNRSILADPRLENIQRDLNLKIKYREGFRPFAPAVLSEYSNVWFDMEFDSPYMLFVRNVHNEKRTQKKEHSSNKRGIFDQLKEVKSKIPAVTHVDYSSRVQTVNRELNSDFYELILEFYKVTNCPLLVNTSMNVRGEPIVCNPIDAFKCLMTAQLDSMIIGRCILNRDDQYNVNGSSDFRISR